MNSSIPFSTVVAPPRSNRKSKFNTLYLYGSIIFYASAFAFLASNITYFDILGASTYLYADYLNKKDEL